MTIPSWRDVAVFCAVVAIAATVATVEGALLGAYLATGPAWGGILGRLLCALAP